ncbi:hypothetical protein CsSME_00008232 [Camellia sinensis var. sinensis]
MALSIKYNCKEVSYSVNDLVFNGLLWGYCCPYCFGFILACYCWPLGCFFWLMPLQPLFVEMVMQMIWLALLCQPSWDD